MNRLISVLSSRKRLFKMDEELDDQALRMIALEHAVNHGQKHGYTAELIVDMATKFYHFLKGMVTLENVQTANH